jgi:hypothetical protein
MGEDAKTLSFTVTVTIPAILTVIPVLATGLGRLTIHGNCLSGCSVILDTDDDNRSTLDRFSFERV